MNRNLLLCLILSLALLLAGCASDLNGNNSEGPTISNVDIPSAVPTNTYHILSATTDLEASLEYDPTEGVIEERYDNLAEWKAPDKAGEVTITIVADQNGKITTISETVQIKEAKVEATKDKFDVDIGGTDPVTITLQNNSGKEIKTLDLTLIAWNQNGPVPSKANNQYTATKTVEPSFNDEDKYTDEVVTANHFENTPAEVHAYVTWIKYKDGDTWSVEN